VSAAIPAGKRSASGWNDSDHLVQGIQRTVRLNCLKLLLDAPKFLDFKICPFFK
jgi:hypothetical protein